ncbi:MAG TPA: ATP-binding protein [Chitinophagaceae bacterium]
MQNRDARLVQSMLEASMHGVMLLEPVRNSNGIIADFKVEAANAAIKNQVGFPIDQDAGLLLSEVFPTYKEHRFFDTYTTALETGQVQHKELYYKDKRLEGWFDLGVAPQDDSVVVTFVNITESKQYQQAIEQTANQLNTIMDIAQTGIFLFSPVHNEQGEIIDFTFTKANTAMASYVGQKPEALMGELGSKWFPGYKVNGLFERYRETFITGITNRFDFHYDEDEIDVWLDILATRLGDEVLVTFTDFTTVKKLQLQMETYVNELKRSNASLEDFAYAASHDLQEPLRKIHFFADRLKEKYQNELGPEGASMLNRMETATGRMRTLIEDLLAYSRVSAKRTTFEEVNTDLLVREVLGDLEASIQEKNASIHIGVLPTIKGDPLQLRQLFQNIIGNALKYNRPEVAPHITISSTPVKARNSGIELLASNGSKMYHKIEITDNGLGFEQEHSERIFQIFQRLHGRSEYPGTGVGLAIVHKVVENHSGYIQAEGAPNKGATFRVWLPA